MQPTQLKAILDEVVVEAELSDADVEDLAERFAEMCGRELASECGCCDCDGSCDDDEDEEETEFTFPINLISSDDDQNPIHIELGAEELSIILDKTNRDKCSFDDAFCAILQEALDLLKEEQEEDSDEETDDEDEPETDAFGF